MTGSGGLGVWAPGLMGQKQLETQFFAGYHMQALHRQQTETHPQYFCDLFLKNGRELFCLIQSSKHRVKQNEGTEEYAQMKEQEKTPGKNSNTSEINNLPDKADAHQSWENNG